MYQDRRELELARRPTSIHSALGRIRGALDLHPACIGGALQRSLKEGTRGGQAGNDCAPQRPPLTLPSLAQPASLPTVFKAIRRRPRPDV